MNHQPTDQAPTIVLVHGAWHHAYHWQPVVAHLNGMGRRVLCIDLPGHGIKVIGSAPGTHPPRADTASAVAGVTIEDAAIAVLDAIRGESGIRPILVGHSIGGVIVGRAAEMAPDFFGHLVYVSGHVPVKLKSPAAYAQLPQWQTGYGTDLFIDNPAVTGVVRINPHGDTGYLERLRQAYYNDVAYADFLPFARALTPDLPLSFWMGESELTAPRWGTVPRTYFRCTLDRALAPAIQSMMIEEADELTPNNRFRVVELEASHSPFASQPKVVADLLASIRVDHAR
jgi:pimeloyl-ACP methyl ester carboxylesterase